MKVTRLAKKDWGKKREEKKEKKMNVKRGGKKAGYTAIPVADGWVGAEMRVFTLFDSCTSTDRRTDGRTDKGSHRVACPQLKRKENGEDTLVDSFFS